MAAVQGASAQIFPNVHAGEPSGRDVSEGLIGSDTIGKLSGPALRIVFCHSQKNVEHGKVGEEEEEEQKVPDD